LQHAVVISSEASRVIDPRVLVRRCDVMGGPDHRPEMVVAVKLRDRRNFKSEKK